MRFIAFDPGTITGFATWDSELEIFEWCELSPMAALDELAAQLEDQTIELVVGERFTISMRTLQSSRRGSHDALDVLGGARYLCYVRGVQLELQQASDAMSFVTDERLRHLGLTPTGHARDATRHLVLSLVRHGFISPAMLVQ